MKLPVVQFEAPTAKATLSQDRFLRLLLLQKATTRTKLAEQGGFSAASTTLRSQWLFENGFLEKLAERQLHSKRPVETLSLRRLSWSVAALRLSAKRLTADLLDSTGNVIWSEAATFSGKRLTVQAEVFQAFREKLEEARRQGEVLRLPLKGMALSIDGVISGSVGPGMIFGLNGIDNWIPCQPRFIDPIFQQITVLNQWTTSVCKLYGLVSDLKIDNRVAYFQVTRKDLHLATIYDGAITLGNLGTSGAFLHQSVQPEGPACYCGRQGCLDALLRSGKATHDQIYGAIQRLLEILGIEYAGIEWTEGASYFPSAFTKKTSQTSIIPVTAPDDLERRGIAFLSVEAALLREVNELQSSHS